MFRPRRDDVPCNAVELSRQLHSSVRSTNLDTSLRLLVQGADPNYFNQVSFHIFNYVIFNIEILLFL